jgi:hypothetical protein
VWKDDTKTLVTTPPTVDRTSMAGHSGSGGSVLSGMAGRSVTAMNAKAAAKPGEKAPAMPSDTITGDLVLFDAINGPNELNSFQVWARTRLNQDLAELKGKTTDKGKLDYLKTAQKLRVVSHGGKYKERADLLNGTVSVWFQQNADELGAFAGGLRANYTFQVIPGEHEELMRGTRADQERAAGKGGILEAIGALHVEFKTVADLPPLPAGDQPKPKPEPKGAVKK